MSSRIFWLGMHKILRTTELVQLRLMGYEVFGPDYISTVYDQSADLSSQSGQESSLPEDVFRKLISFNFFYNEITEEISEILNFYFDAVIVTINPDWLLAVLEAYEGPVLYRTYGQPYSLSEHFNARGAWETMTTRENLHVIPFAAETIEHEQEWFRQLCTEPVPYQIPDDVFEFAKGRRQNAPRRSEIVVSIPNIENPYYSAAYEKFSSRFSEGYFRILGPQRRIPADPRILGEMSRADLLDRMSRASAYFYIYNDPVCYLPPIETMQLGRPVVFGPGSLLARFSNERNPGYARTDEQASALLNRLLKRDSGLAREIVAAQEPVRVRYDRAHVRPIFERVFRRLLANPARPPACEKHGNTIKVSGSDGPGDEVVVVPLHIDGLFHYVDGRPTALEGIPRVVDALVDTVISKSSAHVVVSCTHDSKPVIFDFFRAHISAGRVTIFAFNQQRDEAEAAFEKLRFVEYVSMISQNVKAYIVPHYYLFPEALLNDVPITLYLPDYFPYLMPDEVFDTSSEKDALNKQVGSELGRRATRVLTNSQFTKEYLPQTGLVPEEQGDKIVVAPLPFLGAKRASSLADYERIRLEKAVGGRPFLFYPTANRPNKKLTFFLRLLAFKRLENPELCAVLTCSLDSVPEVRTTAEDYNLTDALVMLPGSNESTMRWLYENTAALCLTSIAEGNFPPQVLEALNYGAPVVATRLPTISEVARSEVGKLLLCNPLDMGDFAEKLAFAMANRDKIIARQNELLKSMHRWNSAEAFATAVARSLPHVQFGASQ